VPEQCLVCKKQTPGARYLFFVLARHRLTCEVVHQEKGFVCDRCAAAQVRFGPLVALFVWVPLLALAVLGLGSTLLPGLLHLSRGFDLGRRFGLFLGMVLLVLALLALIGILVRLAWRQLHAVRVRDYHRLPHSGAVARLAIQARKKELLATLRLPEAKALFLTEEDHARMRRLPRRP
jgi:hypothetical protein